MAKYCDGIALDRRGILEATKGFRRLKAYKHLPALRAALAVHHPNASANELKTTLMSHSITHCNAYFAYFNKIWGIPKETI
jgi:hypothetical protein